MTDKPSPRLPSRFTPRPPCPECGAGADADGTTHHTAPCPYGLATVVADVLAPAAVERLIAARQEREIVELEDARQRAGQTIRIQIQEEPQP